jgi:hypothetical protein
VRSGERQADLGLRDHAVLILIEVPQDGDGLLLVRRDGVDLAKLERARAVLVRERKHLQHSRAERLGDRERRWRRLQRDQRVGEEGDGVLGTLLAQRGERLRERGSDLRRHALEPLITTLRSLNAYLSRLILHPL